MNEVLDIIYDAQCGFCARSLALCRRLAHRPVFRFHDANDHESVNARFPAIAGSDTADAMFAITERGEVFRGFFAFRRMMWTSPWLYPLLPLFYVPGASHMGPRLYAWVARHRRSFGCAATCALPEQPRRPRR
jgi:predicted DCC family thiol-disulfide oxidoreductase YuxK